MFAAAIKACLYLSTILLLGAGVFAYFFDDTPRKLLSRRMLLIGSSLGALLLALVSLADLIYVLYDLLGAFDFVTFWDFLRSTNHGRAVSVRLILLMGLTLLIALARPTIWSKQAFLVLGLGLVTSFSTISHGASMSGSSLFIADLIHFVAAAAWAGPLLYLALSHSWETNPTAYQIALKQVSKVGLLSVIALFMSGLFMSFSYMTEPASFLSSNYGFSLLAKTGMVLIIVSIATYNRFALMPKLLDSQTILAFRETVRWEASLLCLVFILTGALTTRALPHQVNDVLDPFSNFLNFFHFLWR